MSLLSMLNPLHFVGSDICSDEQKQETMKELFSIKPHLAATAGLMLAATSAAISGEQPTANLSFATLTLALGIRVVLQEAYARRMPGPLKQVWLSRFVAGSLFSAFCYGMTAAGLLYGASQNTQLIAVGAACAIVQGVAGRAYMMPGTALLNLLLILGPMSAAAVADGVHLLFPAAVVYIAFLCSFVSMMVKLRMRQLRAEQLSEALMEQILDKNRELEIANTSLANLATTDSLTGLANRRELDRAMAASLEAAVKQALPLSLVLIDVDHFKNFNDTYGHQAGDGCLRMIAKTIQDCDWGKQALVARYGGEEFAVVIWGDSARTVQEVAEHARLSVEAMNLKRASDRSPRQTISLGIVTIIPDTTTTTDELLRRADHALYQAKQNGRNQVVVSPDRFEESPSDRIGWA